MDEINNLAHGFSVALTLPNLGFMLIGITLGVLVSKTALPMKDMANILFERVLV